MKNMVGSIDSYLGAKIVTIAAFAQAASRARRFTVA
jgi:hypothetical protein